MSVVVRSRPHTGVLFLVAGLVVIAGEALILHAMGHTWICPCGSVKLWNGVTGTAENSQHLTDWYTPSHVIHGILFYAALRLLFPRWPIGVRAVIGLLVEASWEVLENTPWIMDRYRTATISLSYFGDSVVNSTSDIVAMLLGFWLASRLPIWASVALAVAMELIVGAIIRDNLTLNIIMLVWPLDAIKTWQAGG
jgi:Protein of unknown function (DUF2585)